MMIAKNLLKLTTTTTTMRRSAASATVTVATVNNNAMGGAHIGQQQQRSFSRFNNNLPSAEAAKSTDMFCFQCEQTKDGTGCTTVGVCGKTPEVAALQDLLIYNLRYTSVYAHNARCMGVCAEQLRPASEFLLHGLYATLTNVNFDPERFVEYLEQCEHHMTQCRALYESACKQHNVQPRSFVMPHGTVSVNTASEQLVHFGREIAGVDGRIRELGQQVGSVQELVSYGLKGLAAYAKEALMFGQSDTAVFDYMHEAMALLSNVPGAVQGLDANNVDTLLNMALRCGEVNIRVMELLDTGATTAFGHPTPTPVLTTPVPGKCILVSGHDLSDLHEILRLTEGTDINVYTHGELLPGHGYPGLKQYKHLVGNYGGPWQLQKMEFSAFPGAILMTTNCIVEPRKSYRNRIFTTGVVGYEGVQHLKSRADFVKVVESAKQLAGFPESVATQEKKYVNTGFAHNAVLGLAPAVIQAVKNGDIKRFWLIGGCDGSEGERSYYKDIATNVPQDNVVMTLGCAKYRFNRYEFGSIDVGGMEGVQIPRLLDIGQCNDSYSAVKIASALADAFGTKDLNDLPISFVISWFEQKAVVVLLTLLKLGLKNMRTGPALPAFIDPVTLQLLVDKWQLHPIAAKDYRADMMAMLKGQ